MFSSSSVAMLFETFPRNKINSWKNFYPPGAQTHAVDSELVRALASDISMERKTAGYTFTRNPYFRLRFAKGKILISTASKYAKL